MGAFNSACFAPPSADRPRVGGMKRRRVRPAVAAFTGAVFAAFLFRSFAVGVGPDEFSLLTMAAAVRNGEFPYAAHWDVRLPLAYLWALPSAYTEEAGTAVALLRLLAWAAQAGAAWIFFCLFQRSLGIAAAAIGALALLAAANMTGLHAAALPNHFSMAMSVAAFACLVAGLRRRRDQGAASGGDPSQRLGGEGRIAYFASALLAGLLPWTMAHTGLAALSLAALAALGESRQRCGPASSEALRQHGEGPGSPKERASANPRAWPWRRPLCWLLVASAPSVALVAVYFLWGPFDTFVRTAFTAPFGVLDMHSAGGGYRPFSGGETWRVIAASPWVIAQTLLLGAGAVWLAGAVRAAPQGTSLRLCLFLVAPLAAGFAVMAYAKPPAPPEYWIDLAPVLALLAAVAASRTLAWPGWAKWRVTRQVRPTVLRSCLAVCLAVILILPVDPWAEVPKPPLPKSYCSDIAAYWTKRLTAQETVLDLVGICGFHLLAAKANLHPPFTFAPLWLRQFDQPWIGQALAGDSTPAAAAARLRKALAPESSAGLILADNQLLREVRNQGWQHWFFEEWRLVWFSRLEGREPEDRLASLAVLVRRHPRP